MHRDPARVEVLKPPTLGVPVLVEPTLMCRALVGPEFDSDPKNRKTRMASVARLVRHPAHRGHTCLHQASPTGSPTTEGKTRHTVRQPGIYLAYRDA